MKGLWLTLLLLSIHDGLSQTANDINTQQQEQPIGLSQANYVNKNRSDLSQNRLDVIENLSQLITSGGENIDQLLAPGSSLPQIFSGGGPLGQLFRPGGNLGQLFAPGGNLAQLFNPGGNIGQLFNPGGNIGQLFNPGGNIGQLFNPGGNIGQLFNPGGNIGQLFDPGNNLAQLFNPIGQNACEKTVTLSPGETAIFKTPNFPENYGKFSQCQTVFKSSSGSSLKMTCTDIDFSYLSQLRVDDGDISFRVSQKGTYISTESELKMRFLNDFIFTGRGASCEITPSTDTPGVTGITETGTTGTGTTGTSTTGTGTTGTDTTGSVTGAGPPGTVPPLTTIGNCKCGQSQANRIVGGTTASRDEFPWQVALMRRSSQFCGGALITNQHVLTAAHCTKPYDASDIRVRLGLLRKYDSSDGIERSVLEIIQRPGYNANTQDNDFAILTIDSVDFSRYPNIRPVCLPESSRASYDHKEATVTGWGATSSGGSSSDVLRKVTVDVVTQDECRTAYQSSAITDNMICAGSSGKDSCQGDSGGPLVYQTTGRFFEEIGVVSWGIGCADARYYGVYSRVSAALAWIYDTTLFATFCARPSG